MPTITDWLMVGITVVYVGATIAICVFNARSAKATKEQTEEMRKQQIENTRARVVARIDYVTDSAVLIFENVGRNFADNLHIDINEDWVSLFTRTQRNKGNFQRFNELRRKNIFLPSQSKIVYPIFYVGDGTGDVTVLSEKPINVILSYNDQSGTYNETINIELGGYTGVVDCDTYSKIKRREIEELKKVTHGLQKIEEAVYSLVPTEETDEEDDSVD